MHPYILSSDQVLEQLNVTKEAGLTDQAVQNSREQYGENAFKQEKPISMFRRILEAMREPMVILLLFAGFITLGVNVARHFTGGEADFLECVGIFIAILLSVVITVVMEGRSAKAFEALRQMNEDIQVKVIRGGKACKIPQQELVVGDIVCIGTGDKIPADGRLLDSVSLYADESALTGESVPVKKDAEIVFDNERTPVAERVNMLYSGSFVTGGSGTMVVTSVGDGTEFGKIARELSSTESTSTPLQEKLAKLGSRITILGASAAAVVFLVQLFQLFSADNVSWMTISEAFITSIILIVAAVPEGLPTIVAVSLSLNIIKMSKQNALVKKMIACETVGCINIICSDKTGTLTENRMTVTGVYCTESKLIGPDEVACPWMLKNFCVNSTADVNHADGKVNFIGNPTECALLVSADKSGVDYKQYRQEANILHVFPFSSEEKHMTTVMAHEDGTCLALTKGSPERIIAMCDLPADKQAEIEAEIIGFQQKSCRIIGFAHKIMPCPQNCEAAHDEIEQHMIFDGFVAITDPLRADVYAAVERCRNAGIGLKMLTGDNIITATAIANDLHLLDDGGIALEAKDIEELSDSELLEKLPYIRVIARSTPVVKMRVVNALKSTGNVVAVTGDGINDAPALKNADVGIAMGITGTEVSKQASDIVLLDDSFSTIVKAVQWGRGIYENFQRFIQFQLTVNLSAVLVVLTSILAGLPAPFTALQMLWVNIVMDGPPALTLGLEPIRSDLMNRKPTKRDASIVSGRMLMQIAFNGLFITLVFLAQQGFNFLGATPEQHSSVLFSLFVMFQLFNAFNSRELSGNSVLRNLASNKLMVLVIGLTFALQIVFVQFFCAFFGTVPLPLDLWLKVIGTAFTVIIASELFKLVQRIVTRAKA